MKIILPLTATIPRKKSTSKHWNLNLNSFRNTHYHTLNQAKHCYMEEVRNSVLIARMQRHEMPEPPFIFTYTIFPPNKRAFDFGNILPIIGKFTEDALIELTLITDDNYRIIQAINYRIGEIDKDNPRCELEITHFG